MDYMSMTDEEFDLFEDRWLDLQTYYATGGSLDVIQAEDAAARISSG